MYEKVNTQKIVMKPRGNCVGSVLAKFGHDKYFY